MGLLGWITKKGKSGKAATPSFSLNQTPCFEQLEPRLLLSADGLLSVESPLYESPFEAAIVVDLDESWNDLGFRIQGSGLSEGHSDGEIQTAEDSETVGQFNALSVSQLATAATLSSVQQNENLPSEADASEGLEPTANHQQPTTDATLGSINPRGPPTTNHQPDHFPKGNYLH